MDNNTLAKLTRIVKELFPEYTVSQVGLLKFVPDRKMLLKGFEDKTYYIKISLIERGFSIKADADIAQDFVQLWNKKNTVKIDKKELSINQEKYIGFLDVAFR